MKCQVLFSLINNGNKNRMSSATILKCFKNSLTLKNIVSQHTSVRLMRPEKTQISPCFSAVLSASSLVACVFYGLQAIQRGIFENHGYTGWMYMLIPVSAGHTGLIEGFLVHYS